MRFKTIDDLVVAYTRNLSRGGMRLRTSQEFPVGSYIEVRIELPDGAPEIAVPCEVVDVFYDATDGAHYLGARFVDPNEQTRRRLEWFILNSEAEQGQFGASPHGYQLQLLIADDEPLQRVSTARPFIERGDQVRVAVDGLDALGKALELVPDVIITDVQMPRMDGWQLLRMLRARPTLARVPVLFLTTLASEKDRLRGYRIGVDDYIAKPPDSRDLVARVDRAAVRFLQLASGGQAPSEGALRGDLEQVSLPSLLSFFELERKSGTLRVGPERNGWIAIREGRPVRAFVEGALPGTAPLDRIHSLLDVTRGRFDFEPGTVEGTDDEIGLSVSGILLEHARLRDEATR
ncbi:MAG: response regulator [Polyangiaceae bacterium]|nr:response regulator [Polyangiaceae bacterium]